MTFHVWRDRYGKWRAVCYRCGYTGSYRYEGEAWGSEQSHLCTEEPPE